jgi:hypothetical protein
LPSGRVRSILPRPVAAALLVLILLACAGCPQNQPVKPRQRYRGPTEAIQEVVAQVNANNRKLGTLWARGAFRAWVPDDRKRIHYVDGDLILQYRKPQGLRLLATKVGVGTIIDLGSNDRNFWCLVKPEIDTMWVGDYNRPLNTRQNMPIRPDLILEVLGIGEINENLLAQPMPVLKFDGERDVYAITWNVRLPDRLAAEKEVWYDRRTKRPVRVTLYDENGRVVLRAELSQHQPVNVAGLPERQWPRIATAYDLYFPDSDVRMVLTLETAWDTHNGFPKDLSFRMPSPRTAAGRVIDLNSADGDDDRPPNQQTPPVNPRRPAPATPATPATQPNAETTLRE